MKILTLGASNSTTSINRKLALYAASFFKGDEIVPYDVSKIALPFYSAEVEAQGIPAEALHFAKLIDDSDLVLISFAENNGSYNATFKNLMDWVSRIKNRKTWGDKPMLMLATSPGARGGATVLEGAKNYLPYLGAQVLASFSLPQFYSNFDDAKGITNETYKQKLIDAVAEVKAKLQNHS